MNGRIRLLLVLAALAVAVRLFALTFLHPLNWDEVEYFRAADWVRQGLVPFRDFWEHHTPLQWFVFAPVTALTDNPGSSAVIVMRWAQVPLWIAAFFLANRLMQRAGIDAFARWIAIVLALSSSLLMISAMEYRVDVLANVLYLGGVLLLVRSGALRDGFAAGVLLCLAGLANLRLGPLLAATAIVGALVDPREGRWRLSKRALALFGGVAAALAAALLYFVATGSLGPFVRHVLVENYIGEKYAQRVPLAFLHRILVPFGVRIYGGGEAFQWSGIDFAGAAVIVLGLIGLVRALRGWRNPDILFVLALLQIANIAFIAGMKFVYHYHLQIAVLLMLPFVAAFAGEVVGAPRWRQAILAFLLVASVLNVLIVLLRGKELELQYQDRIMREAHARTSAGEKVFDGVGWAIRREPAYRFWFLPVLARQLVAHGHAPPYTLAQWISDPPAAVITDRNALVWLRMHPDLAGYVVRHYLPLWRNLLLPGLSARIEPGSDALWIVPADGRYRVIVAPELAAHPWFRHPLAQRVGSDVVLEPLGAASLQWSVDGKAIEPADTIELRRGSRLTAVSAAAEPLGVFLLPGDEKVWFRQPPPDVTLDAEGPRQWHIPVIVSAPTPISSARP
ncbi:MAG TPA: hypothetical protein VNA04_14725 [Thermoanaerobaculia bacterium]|nr:hypothetical protein [Thermoanaerobaculia bacterium]